MSEEKENNEPFDLLSFKNKLESLSEDDNIDDETIIKFLDYAAKDYASRIRLIDTINQTSRRRINLAMFLTQLFARYHKSQIYFFLGGALLILIIQIACSMFTSNETVHFLLRTLMTIFTSIFAIVTINNVINALSDIGRLKRCYCTAGYQITSKKDDESAEEPVSPILIAYKDYDDMIRTLKFPSDYKKYFTEPVLILFLDKADPYKVTILLDLPGITSYDENSQTFTQSWKGAIFTLVPIAMIIMYAISLYLGSRQ